MIQMGKVVVNKISPKELNRLVPFRSFSNDFFRAAFGHLSHVFRIKIQMHIIDMGSNNSEKL